MEKNICGFFKCRTVSIMMFRYNDTLQHYDSQHNSIDAQVFRIFNDVEIG